MTQPPENTDATAAVRRLLGSLPAVLQGLRADGGLIPITAAVWEGDALHGYAPARELEDGVPFAVRIDHPAEGAWEVVLEPLEQFFHSGEESLVHLRVVDARARRTTRGAARVDLGEQALARVLFARDVPRGTEFDVRVADLSATGIGLVTEKPLSLGDLLSLMVDLAGRMVRLEARVVRVGPLPYGRRHAGCEMTKVSEAGRTAIEAVSADATDRGSAAQRAERAAAG